MKLVGGVGAGAGTSILLVVVGRRKFPTLI
mgnify:CR=1 FL=1